MFKLLIYDSQRPVLSVASFRVRLLGGCTRSYQIYEGGVHRPPYHARRSTAAWTARMGRWDGSLQAICANFEHTQSGLIAEIGLVDCRLTYLTCGLMIGGIKRQWFPDKYALDTDSFNSVDIQKGYLDSPYKMGVLGGTIVRVMPLPCSSVPSPSSSFRLVAPPYPRDHLLHLVSRPRARPFDCATVHSR